MAEFARKSPAPRPPSGRPLRVGRRTDPAERQADRIAERVTSGPPGRPCHTCTPGHSGAAAPNTAWLERDDAQPRADTLWLQPECPQRADTLWLQAGPINTGEDGGELSPAAGDRISRKAGSGEPLPRPTREYFEPRLGQDLSEVRVHRDAEAGSLAHGLGARAFTLGQDIFFAPGRFQPETDDGRRLIGHELAHAVQEQPQRAGTHAKPMTAHRTIFRSPDGGEAPVQRQALDENESEEGELQEKPIQRICSECASETADDEAQSKCESCEAEGIEGNVEPVQLWNCREYDEPTCVQTKESPHEEPVQEKCAACVSEHSVQPRSESARSPGKIHQHARSGLRYANQPLPHGSQIQAAFGHHDVSHVRANVGGSAASASRAMGALAFTSGSRIGFRSPPSLRLAAHEAAHVVQQREGLSLPGNVGRAGDRWERHADWVADAVAGGNSAEPLLDQVTGGGAIKSETASDGPVQHQITSEASRLFEPPPAAAETPVETSEERAAPEGASELTEGSGETGAEEHPEREGLAMTAAQEGDIEAPPEGVPSDVSSGGTSPSAGASSEAAGASEAATSAPPGAGGAAAGGGAAPAGGPAAGREAAAPGGTRAATPPRAAQETPGGEGRSAACYTAGTERPRDDTPEPTADERGSNPQEQPQVEFEAWPDAVDDCPAEAALTEGAEQMPAGGGEGLSAAAGAGGRSETPAAAAGLSEGGTLAVAEVRAMSRAASTQADVSAGDTSMEGPIASAEAERQTAVTDYLRSAAGLGQVLARSERLARSVTFPEARGPQQVQIRQTAISETQTFMEGAAAQIASAVAFAQNQAPGRLGGLAESIKANIQAAIESEKVIISERTGQARASARAGAAAARLHINAEYARSAAQIEAVTTDAVRALDAKHLASVALVDEKETTGLDDVNSRFAAGRIQHEEKGPLYARRAIRRGQDHVREYERCKGDYSDDGFWDGCLTVRRARAQQDAACKAAAGYRDVFLRTANKKGYDLIALRKQYRCAVIAGARQVNRTLDDTHDSTVTGLESGRNQAMNAISLARDENLSSINAALSAILQALAAQEHSQRQAVNDTGYLKQLAVEQFAHAGAAGLARGIAAAMDSLEVTLDTLQQRLAQGGIPDPATLAQALAEAEAALGGRMGSLLAKMEEGAENAEGQLEALGAAALEALTMLTDKNDELSAQAESGFAQQMEGLKTGASDTFARLTDNQVEQAQTARTEGSASMDATVAGFDTSLGTIGGRVDEAIATSLGELDQDLNSKLGELDGQIATEAWKAAEKEQPAWKSVVAIVLIIVVIIAAAVISIVTLGAGASLFAIILVGALVGAVSAGLIQIINNWASGQAWHEGVVQAMIIGAVGGAIGGGLGFAGGALAAGAAAGGARVITQLAITVGSDLLAEGLTQTFSYFAFGQEFNWQGFVMAGAMSGVSFRAHPSGARGAGARADVPSTAAAGAAGGRRAAVAQIAGGAALGLGLEYATAKLSGQEFDLTRAASAAASAAVSARMSRRQAGAPPQAEPTSRLGRAAQRVRSFDPGGIGARLETRLQSLGARIAGGRPETGALGAARPRIEEPTTRPVAEPETTRPRPTDEPVTPTRPKTGGPGLAPARQAAAEDVGGVRRSRLETEIGVESPRPRGVRPDADPSMPANKVPDSELADSTRTPTRVGDVDHSVAVRNRAGAAECEVCSFGCGRINNRIDEIEARLRQFDPEHPLLEGLVRLKQQVTDVEAGIENASITHGDAVRRSAEIAEAFRRLGREEPRLGDAINQPSRILPDPQAPHGRVQFRDLGVELDTPDVRPIGKFVELNIPDNTPVLYVLRDIDTGAIMKVGQTTMGSGSDARFQRYHRAGEELGIHLELEVTPIRDLRGQSIEAAEGRLRAQLEDQGHVMPWDYTPPHSYRGPGMGSAGRLGRIGPGTPFEPLPGSSRLRREGYQWERGDVPSKGYLQHPTRHTGVAPETPTQQTANVLRDMPDATRAEQAAALGISVSTLSWRLRTWRDQLRALGADVWEP